MLTSWENVFRKVYNECANRDIDLSVDCFDFDVEMPKSELLHSYSELMDIINGDAVVHLQNFSTAVNLRDASIFVCGFEKDDESAEMSEVYIGNMQDFLKSLNGKETQTGWFRLIDFEYNYNGTEMVVGTKLQFTS